MSAIIMDGREVSRRLRPELEHYARELRERHHRAPALAAVLVGDDPASRQYVRNKRRFAEDLGFESRMVTMTAEEATTERLLEEIAQLNADRVGGRYPAATAATGARRPFSNCSTRSIRPRTSTRWARST